MQASTITDQLHFLRYTYALESISAAMKTRNKDFPVYDEKVTESKKQTFKTMLLNHIIGLWSDAHELDEDTMLNEIIRLKNICEQEEYKHLLKDDNMRIGICQKIICLYAKFLWVSGQLSKPPALIPYDGIVKGLLNDTSLKDWTALDNMNDYQKIRETIMQVSKGQPAIWELEEWNNTFIKKIKSYE